METNGVQLTSEQARAALADTEHVRASAAALSATPWPTWFFVTLTLYIATLPITYGGIAAESDWLLPRAAWIGVMLATTAVYGALLAVATRSWRDRTGVALRFDVLPKRVTVPLMASLPTLLVGSAFAFRVTGQPAWLIAASLIGAAVSVGFHLAFVRLHRKPA
jgi:predicted membrane protein